MEKYSVGTKLLCGDIKGEVIDNFKLPGDVCVRWETGQEASYNDWWLNENVEIVTEYVVSGTSTSYARMLSFRVVYD